MPPTTAQVLQTLTSHPITLSSQLSPSPFASHPQPSSFTPHSHPHPFIQVRSSNLPLPPALAAILIDQLVCGEASVLMLNAFSTFSLLMLGRIGLQVRGRFRAGRRRRRRASLLSLLLAQMSHPICIPIPIPLIAPSHHRLGCYRRLHRNQGILHELRYILCSTSLLYFMCSGTLYFT